MLVTARRHLSNVVEDHPHGLRTLVAHEKGPATLKPGRLGSGKAFQRSSRLPAQAYTTSSSPMSGFRCAQPKRAGLRMASTSSARGVRLFRCTLNRQLEALRASLQPLASQDTPRHGGVVRLYAEDTCSRVGGSIASSKARFQAASRSWYTNRHMLVTSPNRIGQGRFSP